MSREILNFVILFVFLFIENKVTSCYLNNYLAIDAKSCPENVGNFQEEQDQESKPHSLIFAKRDGCFLLFSSPASYGLLGE
ncbi:hypothetical protein [Sphingobacterium anhuiense]|uniref:hypothetical protein n=1 Tax=Sphingobacterium anhuiense TaxID=493780 RepID=UPI003C2B80A3